MRRPAWSHSGGPRNELHRALSRLCTIPELRGVRHNQAPRLTFVRTLTYSKACSGEPEPEAPRAGRNEPMGRSRRE
jgi:hypothetical protein